MMWLNSAALAAAAIDRNTPDPAGGRIGRRPDGEPNGLLFETANALALEAIPAATAAETERAASLAMAEMHRLGVTAVHVPEGPAAFSAFQRLEAAGRLDLRVCMMLSRESLTAAIATGLRTGFGSRRLAVGPVKIFVDGSLGSETAAMLAPFEGSAGNRGILTVPEDEIAATVELAARNGIASAIHAIGDRANRVVLDAFEATREVWEPLGLRQRIEHAQVLHPQDLPRFAALGVIASVQPIHCTQDMDLVDRLWGARGRHAYAFRSLLESGAHLAFGSDAPVETADPLAGLYAAVARRRADGRPHGGWYPQERLSVESAVRAYTIDAAYAAGVESRSGSLAAGKFADFVVLSQDVLASPPEAILETRVTHTVVGGALVFGG
jgi:predicted amidohydrolase YtcJ